MAQAPVLTARPRLKAALAFALGTAPAWVSAVWSLFCSDPFIPTAMTWLSKQGLSPALLWLPSFIGLILLIAIFWRTGPSRKLSTLPPYPPLESPTYPAKVTVLSPPGRDKRVFIEKTPDELVAPLHGRTDATGQRLVAGYLNKWVHWQFPLYDVSQVEEYPWVSAIIEGGNRQLFIRLNALFALSEREKVMHLEKGAVIEIEGKIGSIEKAELKLLDCRLLIAKRSGS